MSEYPDDADGGALRSIAADGSDMSLPMFIDYHVAAPTRPIAESIGEAARGIGYGVEVVDDEDGKFTVWCTREMVATYEGVLACQDELDDLAKPLGGYIDGWGSFGNVEKPPKA